MRYLEVKLQKKLVWLVCMLHTNELPLRHLVIHLDGPTQSNNQFSGNVGKSIVHATECEIDEDFIPITVGPPLIELSQDIINDLSTDQAYGYQIVNAIRAGKITSRLASLQIGPINHSRWLTCANRILRLYVSKHELTGKDLAALNLLAEFIVAVYYPCWFQIKVTLGYKVLSYVVSATVSENSE